MRGTTGFLAAAFLLMASLPVLAQGPAPADRPGAIFAEGRVAVATVEAVDASTREVTLKSEDGDRMTFKAGSEVRNFDRIREGDKVTAEFSRELAVFVAPTGEVPSASETESLGRAAPGRKPAGSFERTVRISAIVEGVDPERRFIALRGPRGNLVTLKVGDHVKKLDKVRVGDTVVAEYAESVDITVTKP